MPKVMLMKSVLLCAMVGLAVAGCGTSRLPESNPGQIEALSSYAATPTDYRIGPMDKLRIQVFQVETLSFDEIQVDVAGNLQMPLVGNVRVAGLSPAEFSRDLEQRLSRYLQQPRVSVAVIQAASQKVTVDGAVMDPGVFELRGDSSLSQAIAMAKGVKPTANLRHVAVFRMVDGQRMAAVFDLAEIRSGRMDDPRILGGDVVVVDTSRTSEMFTTLLALLPSLAMFYAYQ